MPGQEVGHALGIAAVLAHAQRQCLEALYEVEGVEGAERHAEVALQGAAGLHDVGDGAHLLHRLGPHRAVVARVRLVQHREAPGMLLPIEAAAVDDDAADRVAVARSEEHTSELQSLMRISYAVFCLQKKTKI